MSLSIFGAGWQPGYGTTLGHSQNVNLPVEHGWGWYRLWHNVYHYGWLKLRVDGIRQVAPSLVESIRRHLQHPSQLPPLPTSVVHGKAHDADLGALFRASVVNVGFTSTTPGLRDERPRRQVRLRDFEVPLSGGFYKTQDTSDLHELYAVSQEIETWDTIDELYDKCVYYLSHPEQAERIRLQGQARALQDHTWVKRLRDLLNYLSTSS